MLPEPKFGVLLIELRDGELEVRSLSPVISCTEHCARDKPGSSQHTFVVKHLYQDPVHLCGTNVELGKTEFYRRHRDLKN